MASTLSAGTHRASMIRDVRFAAKKRQAKRRNARPGVEEPRQRAMMPSGPSHAGKASTLNAAHERFTIPARVYWQPVAHPPDPGSAPFVAPTAAISEAVNTVTANDINVQWHPEINCHANRQTSTQPVDRIQLLMVRAAYQYLPFR